MAAITYKAGDSGSSVCYALMNCSVKLHVKVNKLGAN